jgi:hypothetical protein
MFTLNEGWALEMNWVMKSVSKFEVNRI